MPGTQKRSLPSRTMPLWYGAAHLFGGVTVGPVYDVEESQLYRLGPSDRMFEWPIYGTSHRRFLAALESPRDELFRSVGLSLRHLGLLPVACDPRKHAESIPLPGCRQCVLARGYSCHTGLTLSARTA